MSATTPMMLILWCRISSRTDAHMYLQYEKHMTDNTADGYKISVMKMFGMFGKLNRISHSSQYMSINTSKNINCPTLHLEDAQLVVNIL